MHLTKNERAAIPFFVKELRTAKGKDAAITFGYLVDDWNYHNQKKISDIGGKKIIRHIRDEGLIKRLMADNYGYFIADNAKAYQNYLDMLARKIAKLRKTYVAMTRQYKGL